MIRPKVKVKSLSHVRLFATPWTVAYQAPPSIGFSRQEYWSGLQFPFAGHLPDPGMPGIKPTSPALEGRFFNTEPPSGQPLEVENGKEWMDYPRASRRNTALLMP